jgi:hypothetical protein
MLEERQAEPAFHIEPGRVIPIGLEPAAGRRYYVPGGACQGWGGNLHSTFCAWKR